MGRLEVCGRELVRGPRTSAASTHTKQEEAGPSMLLLTKMLMVLVVEEGGACGVARTAWGSLSIWALFGMAADWRLVRRMTRRNIKAKVSLIPYEKSLFCLRAPPGVPIRDGSQFGHFGGRRLGCVVSGVCFYYFRW